MAGLQFVLDRAGWPMLWVEAIQAHVHWLPITKLQAEYFLCSTADSQFDERWYEDLLYLNPRVTPEQIHDNNYWKAFLTGLLPHEARSIAQWCDPQCRIPTEDEWLSIYRAMKQIPAQPHVLNLMGSLRPRVQTLLDRVDDVSSAVTGERSRRTLADQMLMRLGVIEWVDCPGRHVRWAGLGQPMPRFVGGFFNPDRGQPHELLDPEAERAYYFGLRLIRRVA